MSRQTAIALTFCALAGLAAGCAEPSPGPEWGGYAPTTPQPTLAPQRLEQRVELLRPPAPTTRPAPDSPMVNIEARFISATPNLIARRFGLTGEELMRASPAKDVDDAIAALRASPYTRTLTMPRMTLWPGQEVSFMMERHSAFVRDLRAERGEQGLAFEPVIDALPEGTRLTVSARIDDAAAVVTHVEGMVARTLGLRECTARSARTDRAGELSWQEGILAEAATSVADPCSIRLEKGQCLILRMPQRVRRTVGNARLYARGPVREKALTRQPPPGKLAAAELETIAIIKASPIRPSPGRHELSPPSL